ncbi:IclR family transcriptional regulator [Bordetella tumulicola]|uniref:IclR family transcriptional regulator n=1 Tax=Bordetella tumulicola TaxID=1649133 RepID=UPI0039EE5369
MNEVQSTPARSGPRIREVPAVTRAFAILRLLGRGGDPLPLKTISEELGMVTSTCLHILRALVSEGLVKVDVASKRYSLDVGMLTLARSVIESSPFPALAQPVLDRLSKEANVTAIGVEITSQDHMVVLALSRSHAPFRLHVDVGSRFPALISATGRLVGAYTTSMDDAEIERRFKALRWDQPPDIEAWRKDVEAVRKKGYSIDRGNYIDGVTVIAVPVFNAHDRLSHSLVAAALSNQLPASKTQALIKELLIEAQTLSTLLAARA